MTRNRAGILIIEQNKIAVIKRTIGKDEYFVIPGGGVDEGESFEEAAVREAEEELGIEVKELYLALEFEQNGSQKYFFGGKYIGELGRGTGEEYRSGRGTYLPCWIDLHRLKDVVLYPEEVKLYLLQQ
ncbi:NUDIX domain-containing protein [Rossellomorea oryzaecorticis]|jgi:8-oxo-dGTP diphosphatase|uniref:NUDIX domain-containing protein n=1 Tax=Rossellomorea oryzaecorticis TaxID=1396505 RepID=A0ABW8VP26_9BACI|nr:NUDIX domain-containing protein [[Bacillus] enclensis]MBH9968662.1 NUDIX domain-containing protein [[Bacillus] enclensis]QTC43190.1 NUDIX domain-containing protein [Bacillus sp. V3]QWC21355.1 NUDIX domain-containing protein [Bacillus haikouensis]